MTLAVSILGAVVLGLGIYLLNRIDDLGKTVREEVLPEIVGLKTTLTGIETRSERLEKRIEDVDARLITLQEQVAAAISGGRIVDDEGTKGSQAQ